MWRYLIGEPGYSGADAHVRWLAGELNRLRFIDHLTEKEATVVRERVHSTWLERLKRYALDPRFLRTWQRAAELLSAPNQRRDPKACLAEAYLLLTKPEGTSCCDPLGYESPVLAFLKKVDGQITTQTVRQYAEELWRGYYREIAKAAGAQAEFNFGPTLANVRWSKLFDELGLTKEFLPRSRGGRPRISRKRPSNKSGKQKISGALNSANQV
jgi:hypothetical protein